MEFNKLIKSSETEENDKNYYLLKKSCTRYLQC